MKEQRVQELPPLQLKPIISYPRIAEAGEQYLLSIDVQLADGSPWPYQEEEFEISFVLETAPFFTHEPLGEQEPGIVLHRFGGTYGPAEYLLTAAHHPVSPGTIKLALLNGWGLPIAQLKLDCEVKREVRGKKLPKITIEHKERFTATLAIAEKHSEFTSSASESPEPHPIDSTLIRSQLEHAGWKVQNLVDADLSSQQGVAIEHHPYFSDDYLLFVDQQFVGIVYTYPTDDALRNIEEDVVDLKSIEGAIESWTKTPVKHTKYRKLPFIYNSTGFETRFTNALEVDPHTRPIFTFHRPETLAQWLKQAPDSGRRNDLFRTRLRNMPPLEREGLREHQFVAIQNIESSLTNNHQKTLVQMTINTGMTYTAAHSMHRLLKYGGARHILYVFESSHTIDYTARILEQLTLPGSEATFSDLYTIQYLQGGLLDQNAAICITTPDQLYTTFIRGTAQQRTREGHISPIHYNSQIPIEYFDVIFIGNCDYFPYQHWQPLIEYFDAFIIGIGDDVGRDLYNLFDNNIIYATSKDDEEIFTYATSKDDEAIQEEIEVSSQRQKQIASTMRAVRNLLRRDEGLSYETDRLSLLVWLLFLKNLDDFEQAQEVMQGPSYNPIIEKGFRWRDWAIDDNPAQRRKGEELLTFINNDLIPYLSKIRSNDNRDIRTIIGTIFRDTTNHIRSGYILREVVDKLNTINFNVSADLQAVSRFYETMLKEMQGFTRDDGEFYTSYALVRFIIDRLQPQLGETLLDPACGTAGFLVETFGRLASRVRTPEQRRQLQDHLIGIEKKPIPYSLAIMNMLLHGIEAPNIIQANALTTDIRQLQEEDRIDIIATTPPFVTIDDEPNAMYALPEGLQRHATRTPLLFMQYILQVLKQPGGRCGVVVPNGFLFWDESAITIRRRLLTRFHLHTIVRLPAGVFSPYTTIPTNILFFEAAQERLYSEANPCTKEVWFYEIPLPEGRRSYTKTRPIPYEAFQPCIAWWNNRVENEHAWKVPIEQILANDCNLDYHNPRNP